MLAPVSASAVSKVTTPFFFYNCEYMMTKAEVSESDPRSVAETIRRAAKNKALARRRHKLAHFAAQTFKNVGIELHVFGHIVGSDRARRVSPYGHGSDEAVAVQCCSESQVSSSQLPPTFSWMAAVMPERRSCDR